MYCKKRSQQCNTKIVQNLANFFSGKPAFAAVYAQVSGKVWFIDMQGWAFKYSFSLWNNIAIQRSWYICYQLSLEIFTKLKFWAKLKHLSWLSCFITVYFINVNTAFDVFPRKTIMVRIAQLQPFVCNKESEDAYHRRQCLTGLIMKGRLQRRTNLQKILG